jgi:hypothetical protein
MSLANHVSKKFYLYRKIALVLATPVFLISCCPKEGVDRSFQNNSYNITVEINDRTIQLPITKLDSDSKLSIILSSGVRLDSQYFSQDSKTKNRFTFFFQDSVTDDSVSTVEVKLIDYQNQNLDYRTIQKSIYQKDPIPIVKNDWDRFLCDLNPIDWILPKANALSCKAKEGSTQSWRSGYLINLELYPEVY